MKTPPVLANETWRKRFCAQRICACHEHQEGAENPQGRLARRNEQEGKRAAATKNPASGRA